ncbi:putative uncharacterized protein [Moritella viscosa]|nr:putative uncharacterized protein [Moritella viscosa]
MLDLSSHLKAFSILALLCTLYLGVMTVSHESSFDEDYHHTHQCEMFSGLQLGLVPDLALPGVIPVKAAVFIQETPTLHSTLPTNRRARSPPRFLNSLT